MKEARRVERLDAFSIIALGVVSELRDLKRFGQPTDQ